MSAGQSPSPYPPSSRPVGGPPRPTGGPAGPSGPSALASAAPVIDPMRLLLTYWPIGIVAGMVGLVLGGVVYFALAKYSPAYVSKAVFQARPPSDRLEEGISGSIGQGGQDEMDIFMETEVQNMISDRMLRAAIAEPDLRETKWINDYFVDGRIDEVSAINDLRDLVSARVVPDTLYMELRARFPSKTDAQTVANVVRTVYQAEVRRTSNLKYNQTIELFEAKKRATIEDIDTLDRRLDNLLDEEQVSSIEQRETAQFAEIQVLQPRLAQIRDERAKIREQLSTYEQMMNAPGGIQFPESIRQSAEQHPIVLSQNQSIANEKAAIRSLLTRYGESHRDIRRRKSIVNALEQERSAILEQKTLELFRTTIESLRSSIANLQESENDLQERLRQAENGLVEVTAVLKTYNNLQQDRVDKQDALAELNSRIQELELKTQQGGRVVLVAAPDLPDERAFPKLTVTVGGTAFLVVAAVGGLILLRELRETRVRGPQDIKAIPRTKVLGVVPDISLDPSKPDSVEMASFDKPQGILAETFRQIRGNLMKCRQEHGLKSIHICSGMPKSGATSITTNLAIKQSVAGERVLIIDGNIRRPAMHKVFGVPLSPGLSDCLLGKSSLADAVVETTHANISLLPAGESMQGVFEKLPTDMMRDIMAEAESTYDIVLVDSAPGVVAEDAVSIANHCDGTILVSRYKNEKRGLVARLRNQLGDTNAEFLGVIVNGVEATAGGYFQKNYRTTHDYTHGDDSKGGDSKPSKGKKAEEAEKISA